MPRDAARNFHVPLPSELYEQLRSEAKRAGQPATMLAREAIAAHLRRRQRAALDAEIIAYARAHAGSAADLDHELEDAAVEHLLHADGEDT